jgi:hypothetical protein
MERQGSAIVARFPPMLNVAVRCAGWSPRKMERQRHAIVNPRFTPMLNVALKFYEI